MKILALISTLFFATISFAQPKISSFSPTKGPADTVVHIYGIGFGTTPAENHVYFGNCRAKVLSASPTELVVKAPFGTTHQNIYVTVNGYTSYAKKPFIPTFEPHLQFNQNSFYPREDFTINETFVRSTNLLDVNNDGKLDVVFISHDTSSLLKKLTVKLNHSTPGNLQFGEGVLVGSFNWETTFRNFNIVFFDFNNDGLLDIMSNNAVLLNETSGNNVQFSDALEIDPSVELPRSYLMDVDFDQKPDIIFVKSDGAYYCKNLTQGNNFLLGPPTLLFPGNYFHSLDACDIDLDGRQDVSVIRSDNQPNSTFYLDIYQNISTATTPQFHLTNTYEFDGYYSVYFADLNEDDKAEMMMPSVINGHAATRLFLNQSSPGNIQIDEAAPLMENVSSWSASPIDVSGDGKVDMVMPMLAHGVAVYKNNSTTGNLNFAPLFHMWPLGFGTFYADCGDMDGDGRADIVFCDFSSNYISIYRNRPPIHCSAKIDAYPYVEDFETNNGFWTPGGTAIDWEWGTPTKSHLSTAASGSKCWTAGGKAKPGYNANQQSFLESPCFNFSTLQKPEIVFNVFWDTETNLDGATLEYSTDAGLSWKLVGNALGDTCYGANWYNTANISALQAPGWSGGTGPQPTGCTATSGSGQWLTAKHILPPELAGWDDVRFRFRFASNATCNSFNGFAIDKVSIREAEPSHRSIIKQCVTTNTVNFSIDSNCISYVMWDFGDPASGDSNYSFEMAPTHQFSGTGTYMVKMTAVDVLGLTIEDSVPQVVIATNKTIDWPGKCDDLPNAILFLNPTGAPDNNYIIQWNLSPLQITPTINNVGAGTYTVFTTYHLACSVFDTFHLVAPIPLVLKDSIHNATCNLSNGYLEVKIAGGARPYQITWTNGAADSVQNNVPAGNYVATVTDAEGCSKTTPPLTVQNEQHNVAVSLGPDRELGFAETILLNPGPFSNYMWQDGSIQPTYLATKAGQYFVTVKDDFGCAGSDTINIKRICKMVVFPNSFTPNGDGLNDGFAPIGDVDFLQNYTLTIFDRWGNKIFKTNDPYKKWMGNTNGNQTNTGNFVWVASYNLCGKPYNKKGNILLVR